MLLHTAVAQFRPTKGDPGESFARIGALVRDAVSGASGQPPADLVVFPETAATGYFLEGGVAEHALTTDEMLARLADAVNLAAAGAEVADVVIGFYERDGDRLYNSSLYAELRPGTCRAVHVHRKVFLPTYGVFQEERFVDPGDGIVAFDTRWGRAALLVCEDLWHAIASTIASLEGADLLIVSSASPARGAEPGIGAPGNVARWEKLARSVAEEHALPVVVSQLVGFEGGKGFAGGSLVAGADGSLVHRAPLWDESMRVVPLELADRSAARAGTFVLADLEKRLTGLVAHRRTASEGAAREATAHPLELIERGRAIEASHADDAQDPGRLAIDTALVEDWLVRFLRDEMVRRRGFEHAVVGLSGGVDSAVAAALCARALGPENVHACLMPYASSSPQSAEHAALVVEALGIDARTIDITGAVDAYLAHEPDADPTRRGNVMARNRMIVLFDQAAKLRALPVGTGNKSERLLGYFTWHADDSPPINPIGDLFKTQVWALARHLDLPAEVVEKPATADLVAGQTDEGDLGVSYAIADLILSHLVEGRSARWLVEAGFDPAHVATVTARLQGTHWKRHLPTVAMLSSTTIGEWYLRPVDY